MNPEVLTRFPIGVTFPSGDDHALGRALETFINEYDCRAPQWHDALVHAESEYSPVRFAQSIVAVIEGAL